MGTEDGSATEQAAEEEDQVTQDNFAEPIDVEPDAPSPTTRDAPREQKFDQPNLTDPASRSQPGPVPAGEAIRDAEDEDRRKIRGKIVFPVLYGAAAQFIIADAAFITYGFYNRWHVDSSVVTAWLSATVVQVVGVVLVVMKFLFPPARR